MLHDRAVVQADDEIAIAINSECTGAIEVHSDRARIGTGAEFEIKLELAVAAVVLVFKRDFKEAVGVLAIGIIAVLLASPVGLSVLQNTVALLFGSG